MGDSEKFEEKYTTISALDGGYLVTVGDRQLIVTSLNKAIKTVKDFLTDGSTTEGE